MGSKGQQTQTQMNAPNPQIGATGSLALNMATGAAQQPFNLPAQPVAGFSPDQMQAFQQTRDAQGMALPYFNAATNAAIQAGSPITGDMVAANYNPFAQNVFANMAETFGQQNRDFTGKAVQAAGGTGASRIGVAQAELARQQGLAAGQTAAGLYGQAQQMTQQDMARRALEANQLASFGPAAQQAQMMGTNALYGMGAQQQGLSQAQQMANYNLQLQRAGYPFQTAQYLAGITGGLSGAMGGTQTTTQSNPPLFNQILGAGVGAAGFGQNMGWWGGGGSGGGSYPGGYNYAPTPNGPGTYAPMYYAQGGGVGGDNDVIPGSHSIVPFMPVQSQRQQFAKPQAASGQSGGIGDALKTAGQIAQMAAMFARRGGRVHATGGGVTPFNAFHGYATDGAVAEYDDDNPMPGQYDIPAPMRAAGTNAWRAGVDADIGAGTTGTDSSPPLAFAGNQPPAMPPAIPQPPMPAPQPAPTSAQPPYMPPPRPYNVDSNDWARRVASSPGTALINMGAAIAGTRGSPLMGLAAGFKGYSDEAARQRAATTKEVSANQASDRLFQDWQKHMTMTPYQAGELAQKKQLLEKQLEQLRLEGLKPFKIGEDPKTGLDVYGIRDPKTNKIVPIDPASGLPRGEAPEQPQKPPEFKDEPPPYGVTELAPQLTPTTVPPAAVPKWMRQAEVAKVKAIDASMNKTRETVDTQRQNLDELKDAYKRVMKDNDKDGFFQKFMTAPGGPKPEARLDWMKAQNAFQRSRGRPETFDPDKVAAMEKAVKIQYSMGTAFAATISPRDSQQMQLGAIAAQPGFTQSAQGMRELIALYDAAQRQGEARHIFWDRWKQINPSSANGFEEDFHNRNPVDRTMVRARIDNVGDRSVLEGDKLKRAVEYLKANPTPENIKVFDSAYGGTSSYFLKGKLNPYG